MSGRWLANKRRDLKERAARKGVPFTLSQDFMCQKYALTHCEVTGIEFEPTGPFARSLDRIDPARGYVEDNVQMVVFLHNVARGAWGDDYLARYIKQLVRLAKQRKNSE